MTSGRSLDSRHVSVESFDQYLRGGVPVVLPIRGTPTMFVFIDPAKPELGLRVEVDSDAYAPDTGLENVVARLADRGGKPSLEVVVIARDLFRDAYPVLCSMADRVQIDHLNPVSGLRVTLDQLAHLLRAPTSISTEREVGLFGELLTLRGLINHVGIQQAVGAWRGPNREEHDFGLAGIDIEVKTTTSERRAHWIDSLTQLQPTVSRPLWLVSHQLTSAGVGFGRTLPELINEVSSALDDAGRDNFSQKLAVAGWSSTYSKLVTSRWERRHISRAFEVDLQFPRLVPDLLQRAGVAVERLAQVRYRVDLEGFERTQNVPAAVTATLGS